VTDIGSFKTRIIEFMHENHLSPEAFAKRVGISSALVAGARHQTWDPRASTLDACLKFIESNQPIESEALEAVEYELPWRLIHREENRALLECASVWSTLGRERLSDILDLYERHEMANRIAVNRMGDDNRIYMERFRPRVWGEPSLVEGLPISELPDKEFGAWGEKSLSKDYIINRPRLVACKIPMQTAVGRHLVPFTALRLPCGEKQDTPAKLIAVTRVEASPIKARLDALDMSSTPAPSPPSRSGHLRLVKS
jgi:hypothetical protein